MPAIELGDRVKDEDLVEYAARFQHRALTDLEVGRLASHGQFTATESAGPGSANLRIPAGQCVGRRGWLCSTARADPSALAVGGVSPSISCARQAAYMDAVTR